MSISSVNVVLKSYINFIFCCILMVENVTLVNSMKIEWFMFLNEKFNNFQLHGYFLSHPRLFCTFSLSLYLTPFNSFSFSKWNLCMRFICISFVSACKCCNWKLDSLSLLMPSLFTPQHTFPYTHTHSHHSRTHFRIRFVRYSHFITFEYQIE